MPALTLYGSAYHLASDTMPFLGAILFVPASSLLAVFSVLLALFHAPPAAACPPSQGRIRESVVWGILGMCVWTVVAAVAMVAVGLRGTPFEPSKRRAMVPLLYLQAAKWAASFAFVCYCFWAAYRIEDSCWPPNLRGLVKGTLWAALAIYTLLALAFYTALNALADYDAEKRWQIRLKKLSHALGCYSTLTQAAPAQEDRGDTPLEELAAWFSRYFGHVDLEKSDVVTGLALAQVLQVQQRKALIAERLRAHGAAASATLQQHGISPSSRRGSRSTRGSGGAPSPAASFGEKAREAGSAEAQGAVLREAQAAELAEQGLAGGGGGHAPPTKYPVDGAGVDVDALFHEWLQRVSAGPQEVVTPSHWGPLLAPHLTPRQSAEIYTGCQQYASLEELLQVQRYAPYAVGAYMVPFKGKPLRSASQVLASAKEPALSQLAGSKARAKQYAAVQQISGTGDADVVYLSFANHALGLCPYQIQLDRATRTVVLSVRGSNSMEDLLTDMMDRPVDITGWLPASLLQEHPGCAAGVCAHMGMFSAAKAVLQDLNAHQILPTLLTGAPLAGEERARQHAWHEPDQRQRRWQQQRVARLSLDAPRRRRWAWRRGELGRLGRRRAQKQGGKAAGQQGGEEGGQRQQQRGQRQRRQARLGDQISGWESDNDDWGSLQGGSSMEMMQPAFSTPARISLTLARPPPPLQRRSLGAAAAGQGLDAIVAPAGGAEASVSGSSAGSGSSELGAAAAAAAVPHSRSDGAVQAAGGQPDRSPGPADHAAALRARGLDCRGWRLVVTGHSLGAAVAALVGLHLRDWCPATHVYAFNPPGGMTTANLAAALEGFVTSVAVGKDSISRTGTVSFEQLLDQAVLALARTRLPKARVLLGLRSRTLRERPLEELFRPVDQIPEEALRYVRQYFEAKLRYAQSFVPMCPPGRLLLLRRLKEDAGAFRQRQALAARRAAGAQTKPAQRPPSAPPLLWCRGCASTLLMWDAVWLPAQRLMEEGILLSSTQGSDHFTSTLTFVLDHLTGQETFTPHTQQDAPQLLPPQPPPPGDGNGDGAALGSGQQQQEQGQEAEADQEPQEEQLAGSAEGQ